jgi:hypothetical protein
LGIRMKVTRSTILTMAALLILVAAIPSALRDTIESGRVYLFSAQFFEELPRRFSGPGRYRFVFQAMMAILVGCRGGLNDARAGRPAYLYGLLAAVGKRKEMLRCGWTAIRDLVCMGIILDAAAQLVIYRQVHPGAALLMGPTMIGVPYAVARALANRVARLTAGGSGK